MVKKADIILKKAALFERLSLYGKKRNFLNAVAQLDPRDIKPTIGRAAQKFDEIKQLLGDLLPADAHALPSADYANTKYMAGILPMFAYNRYKNGQLDKAKYLKVRTLINELGNIVKEVEQYRTSVTNLPETSPETAQMPAGASVTKPSVPTTRRSEETIRQTFDALKNATETDNLKQAFAYIPKVEALLQQMTDAAARAPGNQKIRQLIQEGRAILMQARQRLGMGGTQTIMPEQDKEFNVLETW